MSKLTDMEIKILNDLAEAWNGFVALDPKPSDVDIHDFRISINAAQKDVAYRAAQRSNAETLRR